jgi:polar amino acid transport system substrate-binding protein
MALYETTQRLFSSTAQPLEPKDLQQLTGKRMCLPLGWQPPPSFAPLLAAGQLQRHEPQDLATCARLIDMGRDDIFVADSLLGQRASITQGWRQNASANPKGWSAATTLHFLVPRRRPGAQHLIDEFDRALRQLQENGEYARILHTHRQHALSAE